MKTKKDNTRRDGVRSIDCSAYPVYSQKPEVAAVELLDGAYDIVEIWKAETPAQIAWKTAWLAKAKELGANPSW